MICANWLITKLRKGNKQKGIELLKKVKKTAFTLYYQGLATDNAQYYWDSYEMFLTQGDLFFAKLPMKKLIEHGENEKAIMVAYNSVYNSF